MKILYEELVKESFPKRFKELVSEYNGTYEELAKELGLRSKGNITKYAKGSIIVKITMLAKIADFFKVSPAWLIGLTDDRNYKFK